MLVLVAALLTAEAAHAETRCETRPGVGNTTAMR
jgi:hypothetical protein